MNKGYEQNRRTPEMDKEQLEKVDAGLSEAERTKQKMEDELKDAYRSKQTRMDAWDLVFG